MSSSLLCYTIKRTSNLLKLGVSDQITEYGNRFQPLQALHDRLLSNLIVSSFSHEEAYETAQEFWGSTKVRFADKDKKCSKQVETLLRQGRKNGPGAHHSPNPSQHNRQNGNSK